MRGLAAFIMKGRAQAAAAVSALMVLSWLVSLVSLLSAAGVALPTLRRGASEGIFVMGGASLAVAVAGGFVMGNPLQAAGYSLVIWGPVWLLSVLLRESGRLDWALSGAAFLAMLMVLVIYAAYGNPSGLWEEELQRWSKPFLDDGGKSEAEREMFLRSLTEFARFLTGGIAAGSVLSLSFALLIARWWQADLFNPGGFRAEFQSLRATAASAYILLGLLALAGFGGGGAAELATNLAFPLSMLFLLTGFAVIHAAFSASANGGFWLTGVYVALIFVSPLILVIILIGMSDAWLDWRRRLKAA